MTDTSNYKFDNLQPITYLQKFNKMVEQDIKNPLKLKKNQLKIASLSKFPLPEVYRKMEGIFEAGTKKKDVTNQNIKTKDDLQEEEFLERHTKFMTDTIRKIVEDNEKQQKNLELYKNQYKKRSGSDIITFKSDFKHKSQKDKLTSHGTEQIIKKQQQNTSEQNTRRTIPDQNEESSQMRLTHFEKLHQNRLESLRNINKQKVRIKEPKKIKEFLDSRKNFMSQRKSQFSERAEVDFDNMLPEDQQKNFIEGTYKLLNSQNKIQKEYGDKVEREINTFREQANENIRRTKSQKFW